ncbi:unnamed protein product [Diabrotica balteata]|uniref:Major facilitator superfamily (MFS) profile domain-containing protein n=1 Tax=Diabrotica balteata TaxID=107213 RepID=A0A9N9T8N1_DIABA|nr:unnamed protein product [Diabrotica balteata]
MITKVNFKDETKDEKSWPQILALLNAALIGMVSGIVFAWPSPYILRIVADKVNYDITEEQASYFTTVHVIGLFILPVFLVPVVNIIGRKNSLLLVALPYSICFTIKAFANNLWLLYVARLCGGFGDALLFASMPAYIGEISTPSVRGVWGNAFLCVAYIGQLLINILGSLYTVQQTALMVLVLIAFFLLTFIFRVESPYFLIMKDRSEEAKKSLKILRGKENVELEFNQITLDVKRQMAENGSYLQLINIKANRRALTAATFLRISQLLSGIYVFTSYTQFIFQKAGGNISAQDSSVIYIGAILICYVSASYFSDKLGRRKSYIISIFLSALIMISEGIYFYIDINVPSINMKSVEWLPLAGMLLFVLVSAFGIGLIPTLMLGELFSASVKVKGVCISTMVFAGSSILVNNIFYYLNRYTGLYGPFFFFASCNLISTALAYFIVPETKGKTLEEIQEYLRHK